MEEAALSGETGALSSHAVLMGAGSSSGTQKQRHPGGSVSGSSKLSGSGSTSGGAGNGAGAAGMILSGDAPSVAAKRLFATPVPGAPAAAPAAVVSNSSALAAATVPGTNTTTITGNSIDDVDDCEFDDDLLEKVFREAAEKEKRKAMEQQEREQTASKKELALGQE